jgi:hypothetical protein
MDEIEEAAEGRILTRAHLVRERSRKLVVAKTDAVSAATKRGRTSGAMDIASQQRKARDALNAQRAEAGPELVALQVESAALDGQRKLVAADLGPALDLATLLGVDPAAMTRAFILLVAMLLDPATVLLLMAATALRRSLK